MSPGPHPDPTHSYTLSRYDDGTGSVPCEVEAVDANGSRVVAVVRVEWADGLDPDARPLLRLTVDRAEPGTRIEVRFP